MGMSSARRTSWANQAATAEIQSSPNRSLATARHCPSSPIRHFGSWIAPSAPRSASGRWASQGPTLNRRRCRCGMTLRASSACVDLEIENPMFDCPPASQTSPTRMSSRATVSPLPLTESVRGSAEAASGASCTCQRPLASAMAACCCPAKLTVTSAAGDAQPQIGTGRSRCSTAWSVKIRANRSSASAARPRPPTSSQAMMSRINCIVRPSMERQPRPRGRGQSRRRLLHHPTGGRIVTQALGRPQTGHAAGGRRGAETAGFGHRQAPQQTGQESGQQ